MGEVSLRLTPFQERMGAETGSDIAFHVEAGLIPNVGLHVRNDAIKSSAYSEVMGMNERNSEKSGAGLYT